MSEQLPEMSFNKLFHSNRDIRAIFDTLPDIFLRFDADGIIVDFSPGNGFDLELLPEKIIGELFCKTHPFNANEALCDALTKARDTRSKVEIEYSIEINGKQKFHEALVLPLLQNQILMVIRDVTAHKLIEEQLRHQAFHDKLTGLPNRALFLNGLEQAMARLKRRGSVPFAVLFLDIDRFKILNDSMGHAFGDCLLIEIAKRLKAFLRPRDMIARLNGDEFVLLLDSIGDIKNAVHIAQRLQSEISRAFDLQNETIYTTVSVGITLGDSSYRQPEHLLRDADIAMHRAKAGGNARFEVFDSKMHEHAVRLLQLEKDLRQGIDKHEFQLYYQPVVSLKSGEIVSFEALIRWIHPKRGIICPAEFIPFAEESGLILTIGKWVTDEACHQLQQWQQKIQKQNPLTISVNISSRQFGQSGLVNEISETIQKSKVDPRHIKLEITESMIMDEPESVIKTMTQLRELNIELQVDDFGTGYSSLSYLHRFPISALKVDRSFVSNIGPDGKNGEIVNTIVSLAHNLNLEVIAEGVETKDQFEFLKKIQCDKAQGYYFSPPVTAKDAEKLISDNPYRKLVVEKS